MNELRATMAIAAKDLRLELRTRDMASSVGLFALLIVVTASFALPTFDTNRDDVAAGTLWIAILFASILGVGRAQSLEFEHRCVDGLLLAPVGREYVFLGKFLASLLFTWAVELVLLPAFVVLMQLRPAGGIWMLAAAVLLGTFGLVGLSTLLGVIAVQTRMQQALLPMLVMPVAVPLMIASVRLTQAGLVADPVAANLRWLALLVGFDAVFLLVALLTFPYLVEE